MKENSKRNNVRYYIMLHVLLMIYSFSGVCSKMAAKYESLSIEFCFFYGLILMNLFLYALVWQQLIKHLALTTAFCNKAVNIVWGMVWGILFFREAITWNMILGAIIVIFGVIIVVMSNE